MSRRAVSVIVVPERGKGLSGRLREALANQSAPPLEVIEAKACFRDRGRGPESRTVAPPLGLALNFAACRARGDVLAFVRADLLPATDWVEAVLEGLAAEESPRLLVGRTLTGDQPVAGPLHCALTAESLRGAGGFPETTPVRCIVDRPDGGLLEAGVGRAVECRAMAARLRTPVSRLRVPPRCTAASAPSPLLGAPSSHVTAGLTEAEPAASVIVPVRGHPEWLALCIEGLRRQDFGEDFEVLVAANCPEGDVECIRRDFPYVRVVPCDPGGGPGGQRNRAIEEARGTYIVLTDDDCVAGRSWLRTMVDACRARNGAVVWGWVSTAYPWDRNSRALNLSENGQFRPRHGVVTQGVGGGNMCVERALVCESGARFAEGVYGAEEIQFLLALPDRARPVVHEPRAVVRHLRHDDFMGSLARQYRLGRGSARVRLQQRMRGSSAAEWPFLAPLLAPLRFVLTIWRVLRTAPGELGTLLGLSPLVALHHAAYAAGFAVGALTARPNRGQIPTAAAGGTGGRR